MKKSMKAILVALSALAVSAVATVAVSCSAPTESSSPNTVAEMDLSIRETELSNLLGEGNLFLTTIGQADFDSAKTIIRTVGFADGDYTANNQLTASDVATGDTVVIVVGASGKGMGGSTGITPAGEEARAAAFAAKEGIQIIALHLGGAERRGETSDPTIRTVVGVAKITLVVVGGNDDGKITEWANGAPVYTYSKGAKTVPALKYLLGK